MSYTSNMAAVTAVD